jgi:curli biogenesis system outer membrane secretion channel CsgG
MKPYLGRWMTLLIALTTIALTPAGAEEGNLRYTISVAEFKNEAGWRGRWNLGDAFSTIMTDRLQATGKFIVLGDSDMRDAAMAEQDFATSGRVAGGKKAPKMGRMTPAQLLVRGSITDVSETGGKAGRINFKGISLGGSGGKAEISMTIYLINTETGQVMASQRVTGTSGKRGLGIGYYGSKLGGLTGNLSGFEKDNVGKATETAVDEAIQFLVAQLEDVPWEGTIVMAGSKIIINRGTREGVSTGMKFKVGEVQEIVDPDTGEVLDSEMTTIAQLKVTNVKEKIAYCEALSGADALKKGMTVMPAE